MNVEQIVREHIDKTVHLSLGTSRDGKPWVCEVHFAYDDELNLYFRSLTSRRHSQDIAENSSVAGNIVRQHELGEYPVGIYFEGTARRLEANEDKQKAFECVSQRLQLNDSILEESEREDGHQFYKITVESWYVFGKFSEEGGKKYQLPWNGGKQ